MTNDLKNKLLKLEEYLAGLKKIAIAFSGGVDSSFLLAIAHKVLGENMKAYTINTVYIPDRELEEARKFTGKHKIAHKIINVPLIDIIKRNPADRCYFCKIFIFNKIKEEALLSNITHVAEGTNYDDQNYHRPGMIALKELNILSPLKEFGFTKENIREASKNMQLPTWDKPAYSCLLTRLPYESEVNDRNLKQIEMAENYLNSLGFDGARVRAHENLARIEVLPEHMNKILDAELLKTISTKLKQFGYQFVTLDTNGYISGSFDHAG